MTKTFNHTRLLRSTRKRRLGVTIVEVAIVAPITFLLLIGLIVGGLGAFRYQQVANLAREGASYLSVRGPSYQKRTGNPVPGNTEVMINAIQPLATGLDEDSLKCECLINEDANTVTVSLEYKWIPEAFLIPITLRSTSVMFLEQS